MLSHLNILLSQVAEVAEVGAVAVRGVYYKTLTP
jgi:hypothetical protein